MKENKAVTRTMRPLTNQKAKAKTAKERFAERTKDLAGSARIVADMMQTKGIRGNVKDYVVIAGYRIMDFQGSFDIRKDDGSGETVGIDGIRLVHKRELHTVVGETLAAHFWNRATRTRRRLPGKGA
jgi:hypothetical protein